jgi:Uma2 family endonuclease
MTREEFLAWEERQELRYEFDGSQVMAMTGGTVTHSRLQRNIAISLGGRLRGTRCEFHGSDLKIQTARGFRYSDGFVACAPVAGNATVIREPVVIFEVLSDSTARTDLVTKNQEYAEIATMRRYIVLAQDAVAGPCSNASTAIGWAIFCAQRACFECRKSASSCRSQSFTKALSSLRRNVGRLDPFDPHQRLRRSDALAVCQRIAE